MKNLILAAIATLGLGMGVANAQPLSHPNQPTQTQLFDGGWAGNPPG